MMRNTCASLIAGLREQWRAMPLRLEPRGRGCALARVAGHRRVEALLLSSKRRALPGAITRAAADSMIMFSSL
jgi:hypothetical protein